MTDGHAESTDEMLMIRYKRGDRAAFAELVRRYQTALFNFALRYVKRREAARDLTQEAFLRVVRRAGEFRHESRFSTWVYAILRNLCLDELRRYKHRDHASLDATRDDGSAWIDKVPSTGVKDDAERGVEQERLRVGLSRAIDALPDEQREVFLLRQLGGIPFADIATITETPENTVKSRMRYALDRLQKELSEYEEYARALR
ncbi:MAG TPA: RNA polymerase sigma factor [Polyangiaceae bacterium]|nr:RNA polymerase sigma factor [Polyangiaceae bacterium]